jgi:hypothetical protein
MNPRAIAVAALLVTVSGCCSKPKGSSATTSPPPATTVPPPPPKREILMRGGSDAPPEHWTSRVNSRAAAPSFARADGYAPQLPENIKKALFEAAEQQKSSLRDAAAVDPCLVVCYVHALRSSDRGFFKSLFNSSASELDVHVKLEKDQALVAHGPEDRNWHYVSVPLVDCNARKPWTLRLRDRDGGTSYDELGTVTLRPEFPATKKNGTASLKCRSVSQGEVEAELVDAFAKTDKELEGIVENLAVDPKDPTLGVKPVLTRMQLAVNRLAGWVGWSDPRVIRRRDWGLRILTALQTDRVAFVKDKAATAGRRATFEYGRGEYVVEAVALDCDAKTVKRYAAKAAEERKARPLGCVLQLRTKNVGEDTLSSDLGALLGWRAIVARSDGETAPVSFLALEGPEVTTTPDGIRILEPHSTCMVVMGVPVDAFSTDGAAPALIVMDPFMSREPVFLSLPSGSPPVPAGSGSSMGRPAASGGG